MKKKTLILFMFVCISIFAFGIGKPYQPEACM